MFTQMGPPSPPLSPRSLTLQMPLVPPLCSWRRLNIQACIQGSGPPDHSCPSGRWHCRPCHLRFVLPGQMSLSQVPLSGVVSAGLPPELSKQVTFLTEGVFKIHGKGSISATPPSTLSAWDFGRKGRCCPPGARAREGEANVSRTTTEIRCKITPRPCHCSRLVRGVGRGTLQRASAETCSWVRAWMGRGHSGQREQPMQSPHVTECGWSQAL